MAITAAAISWTAGRYLHPAWFRWLLFAWCLLLLDILMTASRIGDESAYLLISAQVNLLTFWAILGPLSWQLRLPVVLVGSGAIFALCVIVSNYWTSQGWAFTMILAAIVGGALCIGLRLAGFRLHDSRNATCETDAADGRQAHQFGLRHMFLWATAAVPLLLVTRGVDLLFFIPWLDGESAFAAALLATSIATINLVAVWSVLGGGWLIARLASLVVVPAVIAAGITYYSNYLKSLYGMWANVPILDTFIDLRSRWHAWFFVSTALLAALLLFLRASGFLLVRTCRTPAKPQAVG
jgi:hypothetical protein